MGAVQGSVQRDREMHVCARRPLDVEDHTDVRSWTNPDNANSGGEKLCALGTPKGAEVWTYYGLVVGR